MLTEASALAAAQKVFEKASPKILEAIAGRTSQAVNSIRARYTLTFQTHLAKTLSRVAFVKTVVSKDRPVELSKIYVNLNLESERNTIRDSDILNILKGRCRLFVYGTGGAGKTMMMKYLLLNTIGDPSGHIPLFLEFRNLDLSGDITIEQAAYKQIVGDGVTESFDLFIAGLDAGIFIVILDGLDEVGRDTRDDVIGKINFFSNKFDKIPLVISSRPGFSPQNLEVFSAYRVKGLSLQQAVQVVERTPADESLKAEFISRLKSDLYDKHKTFLEVPLLVVMMLLTFSSYADIPDRMTVFYEQAFETLYALHDTTSKGAYKRQHFASLSPDIFRRFFEAFCYITLSKDKFSFLYSELIGFIESSLKVNQIHTDPVLVQKDLEESVCLVQQDGIKYAFVHRSFQEYFAAKFALRYGGANQFDILSNCIGTDYQNNTILMLKEIDDIKFREKWILPALKRMKERLEELSTLPIEKRLLGFVAGFEMTSADRNSDGDLDVNGYVVSQDRILRDLSVPLSRVTDIKTVYGIFSGLVFLSKDRRKAYDLEEMIGDLPDEYLELRSLYEVDEHFYPSAEDVEYDEDEDENGYVIRSVSISLSEQNRKWFEALGLQTRLDDYYKQVEAEVSKVEDQVLRQKRLELEIL